MSDYVFTIDDLRIKTCYICREEEHYNRMFSFLPFHGHFNAICCITFQNNKRRSYCRLVGLVFLSTLIVYIFD
jgi:hypothetical protein